MNLSELLHRCAAPAWDKQKYLGELIGNVSRWDSDLAHGILTFGDQTFRVQVLGSESTISDTWLWGWANERSQLPPELMIASRQLKNYGEQHRIPELTTAYHDLSDTLNGHIFGMIASMVCGGNAYYRAPYDSGAVFLLIRDPLYPPQPFDPLQRIPKMFGELIENVPLRDHRLALYSYLDYYQAEISYDDQQMMGAFRNGTVRATFDALGRLTDLAVENRAP